MTERIDCIVAGAGVIGLAIARRLALAGREVVVLEETDCIGSGTSSRNSEVIHAGIYYPAGSLKARLCVAGKEALYRYCEEHGVAHQRLGKLIVAADAAEAPVLDEIQKRAAANGVHDLEPISAGEAQALEPALSCVAALVSPSTGIIDSHGLMLALQGDAEAHGAMLAFQSRVLDGAVTDRGIRLRVADADRGVTEIEAGLLVNAAGHGAIPLARRIKGLPPAQVPEAHFLKGSYFTLGGRPPFKRLIYPVPVPGGLGTHVTLDLAGQVRFGPDTEVVAGLDYSVDIRRAESFYAAIRRYYPALRDGSLQPGYAGIRPRVGPPGTLSDFMIEGPQSHGVPGLINLFGIESPGLTAALAIADRVAELA